MAQRMVSVLQSVCFVWEEMNELLWIWSFVVAKRWYMLLKISFLFHIWSRNQLSWNIRNICAWVVKVKRVQKDSPSVTYVFLPSPKNSWYFKTVIMYFIHIGDGINSVTFFNLEFCISNVSLLFDVLRTRTRLFFKVYLIWGVDLVVYTFNKQSNMYI